MKKTFVLFLLLTLCAATFAQGKIQLRSIDKAECVKSDYQSLKATFSFSGLEANERMTPRGAFSALAMSNTVIGGNEGDPEIPVVNELIAIPFGATPSIRVTHFSVTDYSLDEYGIHTLVPRQPSLRKDQKPEEAPFVYNAAAYQTRVLASEPKAVVSVEGVMRGVQLGKMTIEPVSYNPASNTLRVFNDIEVEVRFEGADAQATEKRLIDTYSPYFDVIYKQLFNGRAVLDAYTDHPDLYTTPVKMMVITTSTYANSEAFQSWLTWKKQKGIYVEVFTTAQTGTTSSSIKSFIQTQYNQNHPTFLVIVGDTDAITYSLSSSTTSKVTDLYYSSVDGDIFPDLFLSRMPVSSTTELGNLLSKILTYEQYTMADPSYLDNVLLIAGSDATWNPRVGQPTINYAADNYFNTAHGFNHVYKYLSSYTNCYSNMNTGIGFANYTAHGGETGWSGPSFSVSDANSLTNNDKYFWAMGNCCLAANWGYNGTCLAEALLRSANKGAFGYIGSCPETYWWEDYYFGVGATTVINTTPAMSATQTGAYDGMFMDDMYNTLNSVPYLGNVAVTYAHANNFTGSVSDTYYWEAYHCLGDGSVMPYHVNPTTNTVSHASTLGFGLSSFTVSADPGSYVALTKDNEILGVAQVGSTGIVDVPITPVNTLGEVLVVVTRNQRQPYMQTIQCVSLDGAFVSVDSFTPTSAHVGDNTDLSITFKNLGTQATTGTTTVTLTPGSTNVTVVAGTKTFGALASNATTTVSGFRFRINEGVADGTPVTLHYTAVNGSDTWEGNLIITAQEAILEYQGMTWNGSFTPGETLTLSATFKNTGHYQATNSAITLSTTSSYVTINTPSVTAGTLEVGQVVTYDFSVTIDANCPETAQLPVTFTMTANGGLSAQGTETLKNSCLLYFNLSDSYGDGWNGATLTVSFSDGSPSQGLTIASGSSASYTLEVGNGVHVTLTWGQGSYDSECSFTVSYEGDFIIYQSSGTPSAGVLYQFDCNCAILSQSFIITATSSNPSLGTVSGGGEFSFGQTCTLTATPAEGYHFTGWTQNGQLVSSDNPYSFIVNSDMDLTGNFAQGLVIGSGTATNSNLPSYNYYNYSLTEQIYTASELGAAGNITAISFYNAGAEKTRSYDIYLKATTKSTFSGSTDWIAVNSSNKVFSGSVTMTPNTWTLISFDTPFEYDGNTNLVLVVDDNTGAYTSSPHMTCRVFDAASQAIRIYDDNTNFNPSSPSSYNGTVLGVKNQLTISKEAATPHYIINVSMSPAGAGTVTGGGTYNEGATVTLTATPATDFEFTGWEENGNIVSNSPTYTFTAQVNRNIVATFVQIFHQTQTLPEGWEWFSSYLEIGGHEGLLQLEQALTGNGSSIVSQANGFAIFNGTQWSGSLQSLSLEQMYQINNQGGGGLSLSGTLAQPENHPITLHPGWNWIGYPMNENMSVNTALANYTPHDNDIIKSRELFSTYISGYGWWGGLNVLHAGEGFMYRSTATDNTTLVYHAGARIPAENESADLHWTPVSSPFVNNATLMLTLDETVLSLSEDIEIGAFVGGECRGSAKMLYVEPAGRYMAFLTVYGELTDELSFMVRQGENTYLANERVEYADNLVLGSVKTPFTLSINPIKQLTVYPNPVSVNTAFRMELPSDIDLSDCRLEVYNALGVMVRAERYNASGIQGLSKAGVYTLKVTDINGNTVIGRLIVQ